MIDTVSSHKRLHRDLIMFHSYTWRRQLSCTHTHTEASVTHRRQLSYTLRRLLSHILTRRQLFYTYI